MNINDLTQAEFKAIQLGLQAIIKTLENGLREYKDDISIEEVQSSREMLYASKKALDKTIIQAGGIFYEL